MKDIHYKIVSSIRDISKDDFQNCVEDMAEGYEFFQTLESSHLEGFVYFYLLVYQQTELVLFAPLFIFDFDLTAGLEAVSRSVVKSLRLLWPRLLIIKTLFCGSPCGEYGFIGLKRQSISSDVLLDELLKGMKDIGRQQKTPLMCFKDFLQKDAKLFVRLKDCGFFQAHSFPSVMVDLPFGSMEAYLASLGRATRKDLKRKIKRASSAGSFTVKVMSSAETIINEIYPLYLNTYHAGMVKFEKLTKDFFLQASRLMPSKIFLYYCNEKLAAFNFCFIYKDILIDKFIGLDYSLTRQFPLYFLSWFYNIEWCLNNGIKHYQVGQTDYEPKMRLGGHKVPLYVYLKHRNPLTHRLLAMAAKNLAPEDLK